MRIKAQATSRTPAGGFKGLIPISYKGVPGRNGRYFLPPGYIGRCSGEVLKPHGWMVCAITGLDAVSPTDRSITPINILSTAHS